MPVKKPILSKVAHLKDISRPLTIGFSEQECGQTKHINMSNKANFTKHATTRSGTQIMKYRIVKIQIKILKDQSFRQHQQSQYQPSQYQSPRQNFFFEKV
jgi:expansin (peptidoglycan-binding protein)